MTLNDRRDMSRGSALWRPSQQQVLLFILCSVKLFRPAESPNTYMCTYTPEHRHRWSTSEGMLNEITVNFLAKASYENAKETYILGNIQERAKASCKQEASNSPMTCEPTADFPLEEYCSLDRSCFPYCKLETKARSAMKLALEIPLAEVMVVIDMRLENSCFIDDYPSSAERSVTSVLVCHSPRYQRSDRDAGRKAFPGKQQSPWCEPRDRGDVMDPFLTKFFEIVPRAVFLQESFRNETTRLGQKEPALISFE